MPAAWMDTRAPLSTQVAEGALLALQLLLAEQLLASPSHQARQGSLPAHSNISCQLHRLLSAASNVLHLSSTNNPM